MLKVSKNNLASGHSMSFDIIRPRPIFRGVGCGGGL